MARANRHYIPGYIWHLTHRCHQNEFLLKFARDRKRWIYWLFEAKKRYGLSVLNYMVTSNHIHLLVHDNKGQVVIPKSMRLLASRTGQEYNARKQRKGAFWEDRYHSTAIETNIPLARCLTYIDLNMVRAGAVDHPANWSFCGYNEIQSPPARYRILDLDGLRKLLGFDSFHDLQATHRKWVEDSLVGGNYERQNQWTESIAVGSKSYVENVKETLGFRARGRTVIGEKDRYQLRENTFSFGDPDLAGMVNTFLWNVT